MELEQWQILGRHPGQIKRKYRVYTGSTVAHTTAGARVKINTRYRLNPLIRTVCSV